MQPIVDILTRRVRDTLDIEDVPKVVPTQNPRFGDYQFNGSMALAKRFKTKPREIAEKIISALDVEDCCEPPEIAGPGFINFRLRADWVSQRLLAAEADEKLGVAPTETPQRVVVDYSGPNIAKQMHVGHLRSTIIGDAVARILAFAGHDVIRQNHLGDWGTQFGMLIAYLRREYPDALNEGTDLHISDLEDFYRRAREAFDGDADFADTARREVVALQAHEKDSLTAWRVIVAESRRQFQALYARLGVGLDESHERGESAYNDNLPGVLEALREAELLTESNGAQCVFPDGFTNRDGDPLPLIVQKSDGGYLYATTDLAALRYRIEHLKADRIIYVTDSRQSLHFEQIFACARLAGWAPPHVRLDHVTFGTILGPNGKPLKTRTGENVKLKALLDEAEQRAFDMVSQKNPDWSQSDRREIAGVVGIGAVKYADMVPSRESDYVFSWSKLLALDGNTAPYLQYACARVASIYRKGGLDMRKAGHTVKELTLTDPAEKALGRHLIRFDEVISTVAEELMPHFLCHYLYELAGRFMAFYENCPVLKAPDDDTRRRRLLLCDLTARTINTGLALLGINTLDRM